MKKNVRERNLKPHSRRRRVGVSWLIALATVMLLLAGCNDVGQSQPAEIETALPDTTVGDGVVVVAAPAADAHAGADAAQPQASEEQPESTVGDADEPADMPPNATPSVVSASAASGDGDRPLDETTNILILGSDRRPDTPNWRTDVMMIVALDRENGRAGVISIPRDLFIDDIPNHEPNRINVVDYLGELDEPDGGGPALLSSIIEARMGVPIDHHLRFSFDSFRDVVDALGGVDVDVDCEFRGFVEEEGGWLVLDPGMNRMSGNQAMIYVRDRQLSGGDLNRARRQQRFVWAVRNQVLEENLLPRLPALYSALSGSVDTDIGLVTALRLARLALELDTDDLYGMVIAPPEMVEEGWALGMSVFLPHWDLIAENVQLVFDNPPFAIGNTPEDCR